VGPRAVSTTLGEASATTSSGGRCCGLVSPGVRRGRARSARWSAPVDDGSRPSGRRPGQARRPPVRHQPV